jgi:hypothetical protein
MSGRGRADEIIMAVALEYTRTHKPVSGVSIGPTFEWWMECEGRFGRDLWIMQRYAGKKSVKSDFLTKPLRPSYILPKHTRNE